MVVELGWLGEADRHLNRNHSLLQRKAQTFQLDGHVHVAERDLVRHGELDRGEVQDAADAGFHQAVGHFLGGGGGGGDDAHVELAGAGAVQEVVEVLNFDVFPLLADSIRRAIAEAPLGLYVG